MSEIFQPGVPHAGCALALMALVVALTGCGGGDANGVAGSLPDGSPLTLVRSDTNEIPDSVTIPEYKTLRATVTSVTGGVVPDATVQAALAADNHHLAVTQLNAVLVAQSGADGQTANPVVVPPLTYAVLRSLGAAASGASLDEISASFKLSASMFEAALQTDRIISEWWADRGRRFRTGFLAANDALGLWTRWADWSAAETGFADGSASGDAALTQSFAAASPDLSLNNFSALTDIRLLATHSLAATGVWGAVTPFDGIFERSGPQDLLRLPLLRLTTGVRRHSGADFNVDMLAIGELGGLRLMNLRPTTGTLTDFTAARLEPALAEAIQALAAGAGTPIAGEMVLPAMDITLPLQADASLRRAGVNLVYDEVNANLKNLDGVGGTYVQSASPAARLRIAADGLALRAAHAMAFTFSPLNIHGPNYSSGVDSSTSSFHAYPDSCSWPSVDLRSFFLVLLDSHNRVVSLLAMQSPPGVEVAPDCSPY